MCPCQQRLLLVEQLLSAGWWALPPCHALSRLVSRGLGLWNWYLNSHRASSWLIFSLALDQEDLVFPLFEWLCSEVSQMEYTSGLSSFSHSAVVVLSCSLGLYLQGYISFQCLNPRITSLRPRSVSSVGLSWEDTNTLVSEGRPDPDGYPM